MAESGKRNHYTTVAMAPCKICGGKSTGYHFGAITCEACKAFFRRAIGRNSYCDQKCWRNDKCGDNPKRITSCVACRLRRCLEVGMSKESVRRGRYSIALRTKSILEAKRVAQEKQNKNGRIDGPRDMKLQNNNGICSQDIKRRLENDFAGPKQSGKQSIEETSTNFSSSADRRNSESAHTDSVLWKVLTQEYSVTEKKYMESIIDRLVALQQMVYPHHEVTEDMVQKQKQIQLEHQYREEAFLCLFGSTHSMASTNDFQEALNKANLELDDRLRTFKEKALATEKNIILYIHQANFIPGFERLDKEDIHLLLKASYSEFWLFSNFSSINSDTGVSGGTDGVINAHKKVTSSFFDQDHIESTFKYAKTLQHMDLTKEEIAIIRVILLTFTDRCTLANPSKVESLQMLFIRCLIYYLFRSRAEPSQRFCKIMERLVAVRNLTHRNAAVNRKFLHEWGFLIENFPIWKAMMKFTVDNI